MNSSIISEFYKSLYIQVENSMLEAARYIFKACLVMVLEYYLIILVIIFSLFILAILNWFLNNKKPLGSFLYYFLYFGITVLLIIIMGPEVIFDDYFKLLCVSILNPICFSLVGILLYKRSF